MALGSFPVKSQRMAHSREAEVGALMLEPRKENHLPISPQPRSEVPGGFTDATC